MGWVGSRRQVKPSTGTGKSRCVFNEAQKQPQCTRQDKTVAGSSLTPHAALLVHPSGTIHPIVDCHEFTWKINAACESRSGHPQPCPELG